MVILHPSRVDNKRYRLNLMDENAVREKVKILKRRQENLERQNQKILLLLIHRFRSRNWCMVKKIT